MKIHEFSCYFIKHEFQNSGDSLDYLLTYIKLQVQSFIHTSLLKAFSILLTPQIDNF